MPNPLIPPPDLIQDLRTFLRDKEDFNRLLDNQSNKELSDAEMALALKMALSDFNATMPKTSKGYGDVPIAILLFGGLVMACHILGLGQTRNELNYLSGGVSIRVSDKTPHYMNWIGSITSKYENMKQNYKVYANVMASTGANAPSEYAGISFTLV